MAAGSLELRAGSDTLRLRAGSGTLASAPAFAAPSGLEQPFRVALQLGAGSSGHFEHDAVIVNSYVFKRQLTRQPLASKASNATNANLPIDISSVYVLCDSFRRGWTSGNRYVLEN